MGTIDLNDSLNYPLLHFIHSEKFFIKDTSRLNRINGFKIRTFPLDIKHHWKSTLSMSSFIRTYCSTLLNCHISDSPFPDIGWKNSSRTYDEILHWINVSKDKILIFFNWIIIIQISIFFFNITGKKSLYDQLYKRICFRSKLSCHRYCMHSIDCITFICMSSG